MIKCFKCEDYEVDLFTPFNKNSRSLVILPGSKVRKDHKSKI